MGSQESASGMEDFAEWIKERAFAEMPVSVGFRHLSEQEKTFIDLTILRSMATNRRIETKLLKLGYDNEDVLDPLKY